MGVEEKAYNSDGRSGDEVTDEEKEFNSIMELDSILKDLLEKTFVESEL
jgi:hypothetical protein